MFALPLNGTVWHRLLVCLFLLTGLLATGAGVRPASAQQSAPIDDDTTQRYGWVNGGVGSGRTGLGLSIAGGVPVGDGLFVGGRHVRTTEFDLLASGPSATTWDAGPLAGFVIAEGRYGQMSLGGGIALVGGRRPDEPGVKSSTLGIPLDAQAFFAPSRYVGVGIHGYANVNPDDNLLGVSVQLQARIPR